MSLERYLEAAGRKNTQRRRTCRLLATITAPNRQRKRHLLSARRSATEV